VRLAADHIEIDPIVGQQAAEALAETADREQRLSLGGAIDRRPNRPRFANSTTRTRVGRE